MRINILAVALGLLCTGVRADEVADLRSALERTKAERDALLEKVVILGDAVNQLQTRNNTLEEDKQRLAAQLAYSRWPSEWSHLRQLGFDHGRSWDLWLITELNGVVIATTDKLIEISSGADDGLTVGAEVELSRERQVLGRAIIRKVTANRSVAELSATAQRAVQKGDRVGWPSQPQAKRTTTQFPNQDAGASCSQLTPDP